MNDSSLYVALRFDKDESLRKILAENFNVDYCIHIEEGNSILYDDPPIVSVACFFGSEKCFRCLETMGCDLNKSDKQRVTFY